ncbi:heme lyase CcmF/NrfE family subunit [Caldimonas thermodepolymerans]|uniref:Cytochrome c-type biogenesis protein CcmF n=1 Tax=Caldimonas thermodepolymerans TaxID=215580 RepID=A0AA46DDG0_9BURK|nr:heme lyase CcmF/NrfE family subunit [Caldimonas thermodepolymerans]TCP07156.1 cytochrome c-type biogenesis protein CcmF [Caldimonas thermodepolymerans]UZG46602.1 heme lyase CcmF/NrfE family subunit [Caldimonas thermodepolymerans]
MIPELGQVALLLALAVALVQASVPLAGAVRGRADWMALARPAAGVGCLLAATAMACLVASFVRLDPSVAYVARHADAMLPTGYRIAAAWAGHEGSMLLWLLMLNAWAWAVARGSAGLPPPFVARVLAVLGGMAAGLALLILGVSNPFGRLWPAPLDGQGLNPLLQHPGMALHPLLLHTGYVGLAVTFAFAVAALLEGRLDATWARWVRPWTTAAWGSLTLGILAGSLWAYDVLGWGGWWFWDPVENASFMPWLAATALIHALAVTEKRGAFKGWTLLLALLAFSLSLLGTFLVRSGVLSSVHAFATDPRRGLSLLVFVLLVVGGALALYAARAPRLGLGARFGPVSRESLLLAQTVLLVVAMLTVLLGTLYPLVIEALGAAPISVGAPYFETVLAPPLLAMLWLLGLGVRLPWKQATWRDAWGRMRRPGALALGAAAGAAWVTGRSAPGIVLGWALGCWILATLVADLRERGAKGRMLRLPRAATGMHLAHLGVAVFAFGVCMSGDVLQRDAKLGMGDSAGLGGHVFTFRGVRDVHGPNYLAQQALIDVHRDGQLVAQLTPEKRLYHHQRSPVTEVAIARGVVRDLYVALAEPVDGGAAWIVRLRLQPFVNWIWAGALLMALGGALAASDRRYRGREHRHDVPAPAWQEARA